MHDDHSSDLLEITEASKQFESLTKLFSPFNSDEVEEERQLQSAHAVVKKTI